MNYELRPLLLKDAKQIFGAKILGSFPSIKACREHLRSLLQVAEESDRHPFVFTADEKAVSCLMDAPASPDTYLRLLTLFTSDSLIASQEGTAQAFERELLDYLVSQAHVAGAYLLLGGFEEILPCNSHLPLQSLGKVPFVLAPGLEAPLGDLWINMIDLREVLTESIAFYPTEQTLLILKADQDAIFSVDFHKPKDFFVDMQTRRWAQVAGLIDYGSGKPMQPWIQPNAPKHLYTAIDQLREYFQGEREQFDLPLRAEGTEFQHSVWNILKTIPYGEPRSYLQVSEELSANVADAKNRTRAVGAACGANPLPIFVPCHRVLSSDGKLHGFRGGLKVKAALLDHEMRGRLFP